MEGETITSRDNPQVKLAAALLARRKEREETGLFVAEGLRLCLDAADSGVAIRTLLLTPEASERYPETDRLRRAAGRTLIISGALAERIADTRSPQGVFAICEKLDIRRCAVTIKGSGHYLLLENIQDPGNLGAMLRTADALGIDGVFLGGGCADLYSPKVLRGSMGGIFRVPFSAADSLLPVIARLREAGVPVYAAALEETALTAGKVDFSRGGAVLVGNEGSGLPEELIAACTAGLMIPMAGGANSLNAAVAAAILLWEMKR